MAAEPAKIDADRFGVGWLERDGVFESYNERVRFRRRPGWELLVDDMAMLGHPGAGAGLYQPEDELAIYFIIERRIDEPQQRYREARRETTLAAFRASVPESPMTASFANTQLAFEAASDERASDEFLHAVHFVDDDALQIVVTYPRSDERERVRELVREVLADIELMSEREVEAIRAELARGPDTQNFVGLTWSLRRGVYRDFAHDLTWTSPGRDWVIQAGPLTSRFGEETALVLQNRMERLSARLSVWDDPVIASIDEASWHEINIKSFIGDSEVDRLGPPRRVMLGETETLVQTLRLEFWGTRGPYVLATSKHGSVGLAWLIGPEREVEGNAALIDAVLLNTRLGSGLVATRRDGARWVDRRLGYSLEIPPDHPRLNKPSVTVEAGTEVFVWGTVDGSSAVSVFVYPWACSGWGREDLLLDVENYFSELWGPTVAVLDASLDGEPGKHLRWDSPHRRDMLIVNRDHTVYMLLSQGDDPDLFARTRESFAFVD